MFPHPRDFPRVTAEILRENFHAGLYCGLTEMLWICYLSHNLFLSRSQYIHNIATCSDVVNLLKPFYMLYNLLQICYGLLVNLLHFA